ncbi:MAG: SUMF1/EgtB/PvdO family nonheme iron enzyme [Ignavibacteriales bacterium]|nr:SUMF1/EgtB/PvdO family nonheme iron enzyme [Ignavibacteriales bacterium]
MNRESRNSPTVIIALALLSLCVASAQGQATRNASKTTFVEGGEFLMGSVVKRDYALPPHKVRVDDFYIGVFEVTRAEWRRVMRDEVFGPGNDNHPASLLTMDRIASYCNERSRQEGLTPCYTIGKSRDEIFCDFNANGYRLPTEAEWEFAARGGAKGDLFTIYSGSDNPNRVAWHAGNSGGAPQPVGELEPNELGLYDMSGNVAELCWDWYSSRYYGVGPKDNPRGPDRGMAIVVRGGACYLSPDDARATKRSSIGDRSASDFIGFRVVRSAK